MILPKYSYKLLDFIFEVWDERPSIQDLFTVNQVHGNLIANTSCDTSDMEADGIISTNKLPIAIKTADCLPLAFASKEGAALIHAGWKGLESNIFNNEDLKSLRPEKVLIGPHIRDRNYEVSLDFIKFFPKSNNFKEIEGRIYFNMSREAIDQLKNIYPLASIIDCELDTFSDERFFSYRKGDRDKRNWNTLRKI